MPGWKSRTVAEQERPCPLASLSVNALMFRRIFELVSLPTAPVEDMMWCEVTPASRLPAVLLAPADSAESMASCT